MGSITISTGRISAPRGNSTTRSSSSREPKDKPMFDVEATAREAARHIIKLIDKPNGPYKSKLTLGRRQVFWRWVLKNMPPCEAKPKQREQVARRVAGLLPAGNNSTARLVQSMGGKSQFYTVTDMGRVYANDPMQYEELVKDKARRARAMHPSTGTINMVGKKSEAVA